MEIYILIGIAVIAIIVGKSIYDKKQYKERLLRKLKKQWGEVPQQEYSSDKMESLLYYYNTIKNMNTDVDTITWNDLDMNQIFMTINNTSSSAGEEYLYAILHQLQFDEKELKKRNRLIEFFSTHASERLQVQEILCSVGKEKNLSIYEYMNRLQALPKEENLPHYMMNFTLAAAVAFIFLNPLLGILCSVFCIVYNCYRYYKRKADIEKYFTVISHIIRLLDGVKMLGACNIPELQEYIETLKQAGKSFERFRKGAGVIASKKATGSMADFLLDYLRMIFHFDLIKFNNMMRTFENKPKDFNTLFEIIGLMDSTIAIASFRELMEEYCLPELVSGGKPFLEAEQIYHPMLNHPIKNTIKENKCVLITGSNASGKSTFIKTLAINAILAQTIYTCMSDSYHASFFKVASSMALQDNLSGNESYYIVEIKSLKRILDNLNNKFPVLCFVDEVLRGTNTVERIAASSQILYSFAKANAICFAATHDIELTHILEKAYSSYHFQEQVENKEILFDYKLYEGRAISRNAIKLLGIIGYSEDIINKAEATANEFTQYGNWKLVK